MKPTLFELFGWGAPSYAVFMALGFALAFWVVHRQVRRSTVPASDGGLSHPQVSDLYLVMLISALLGSKVAHVLFESPGHKLPDGRIAQSMWELLEVDPWHWIRLDDAGYVWYGGLLGALFTAVYYFWRRPELRAWLYADAFAPAIVAGAVLGRLGCFLAGCCHGRPTDVPWAVKFVTTQVPVHPTQLYDATAALLLAVPLYLRFPRRRFEGESIALLLMGYALLRATTEAFRGDAERGTFGALSTSQLISVPLFLVGLGLWFWRKKAATPARSA